MKRPPHYVLLGLALAVLCQPRPAGAQRLVDDWLVRTSAGPGTLQTGASATFWNPAGIAQQPGRGSLLLVEVLAPAGTGVDVLALGGSYRLDERTTVAAGYQHFGVGGIELTEDSPDGGTRIDVSQDLFALSAARELAPGLQVGAGAQYLRSSEALNEDGQLGIGAGARLRVPLPVPVTVGSYAYSVSERVLWGAAAEVAPGLPFEDWRAAATVGVEGGHAVRGTTYRGGLVTGWRDLVEVGASLVVEPDAADRQWEPVVAGTVRLSRYELGVVREWLPNSFGTVHTFRFGITF